MVSGVISRSGEVDLERAAAGPPPKSSLILVQTVLGRRSVEEQVDGRRALPQRGSVADAKRPSARIDGRAAVK